MSSFFKMFFASLLALVVFVLVALFFLVAAIRSAAKDKVNVARKSVLVLNLGQFYNEQVTQPPLAVISGDVEKIIPGLYDVVRLLKKAKEDDKIEGLLIQAVASPNGHAASTEIRDALVDFKKSGKFIIAHADVITQRSYSIANIADKIYLSPHGYLEWRGYSVEYAFLKGTLEKLDIEPQVFYAGKFKSATEPFRSDKMTEENRLQTTVWMNDLYNDLLLQTAAARKLDTAILRRLAVSGSVQTARDALDHGLVDGLKYDDEIKDELKARLDIGKYERINFISINAYRAAGTYTPKKGEKIALIYAEGNIIDGEGEQGKIGGESYRSLIRKARLDRSIKAIVLRINSGGGSAMASENIWRELELAKKEKPVIVSFGDVAASGGYYIACMADSIFSQPSTITGSIGVFGIVPNMQGFFKNKLGITFDGVKTGPYADGMTITRPMNEQEKKIIQAEIDNIYSLFKKRVADGRKKDTAYIDSIAQGRIWTGTRAREIGLVDRLGGLETAIASAARKARLDDYQVKEYPEPVNIFGQLFGRSNDPVNYSNLLKQELGEENYRIFKQMKEVRDMTNSAQARIPFEFFIR
ncbi:MAG TPA: signal peptide peptidase SppA [Chitinophagaceae bacterium]|nr:signal peptide peptidase SppA [Chitinophagaceae bacterium]